MFKPCVFFRGELHRDGQGRLETVDLVEALQAFVEWLDSLGGTFARPCQRFDLE